MMGRTEAAGVLELECGCVVAELAMTLFPEWGPEDGLPAIGYEVIERCDEHDGRGRE